jgi:2-oxo-3-hexenedioate decarboxylase/2-keto-4-pentenoate hydratase
MTDNRQFQGAARYLWEEHQARRPFGPVPKPYTPGSLDEAYAVQGEFQKLLAEIHGPIAGYKVALTTPVMRQMVGVHEPVIGGIFSRTIRHSPAAVRAADYVRLGVECEIAVQLNADLPAVGAPYNRGSIASAIGLVRAAFELVDDRRADYGRLAADVFSSIADNSWNVGVVLGPEVADWRSLDLAGVWGRMFINGALVGEGRGGDVMGHPLEPLAWLANHFARKGNGLSKGLIVMTGSVVTTKFVNPGDTVRMSMEGLGEASLRVD